MKKNNIHLICLLIIAITFMYACDSVPLMNNHKAEKEKLYRDSITQIKIKSLLNKNFELTNNFICKNPDTLKIALENAYKLNNNKLFWQDADTKKTDSSALLSALNLLKNIESYGISKNFYNTSAIEKMYEQLTSTKDSLITLDSMAKFDVLLSRAVLGIGSDLLSGRISPRGAFDMQPRSTNLAAWLQQAISTKNLAAAIDSIDCKYNGYKKLKNALKNTEISQEQKNKIALNMERYRWLPNPQALGNRYVWVNIPEYTLYMVDKNDTVAKMNVVVGEAKNATPSVAAKPMKNVILSPVWDIPMSIAKEEMEYIIKNPAVLIVADVDVWVDGKKVEPRSVDWKNISLSRVKMRQKPKKTNSMGKVKFPFENGYGVYIHDTPNKVTFNETNRAQSHGCVRVGDPAELAFQCLKGNNTWTKDRIAAGMNSGKQTFIDLPEKIKVNILYLTTWIDNNGKLIIGKDPYGYDSRQLKALLNN